ncbi:MAG: antibiotic biosynthesis monooxygenase [Actinomycetales bacterium]|nr:antibiotic biosynthesis monooxygenase [Actinomycetales bacterium]
MILRLWSGWTTPDLAADYDRVLDTEVAPGIVERGLPGLEQFEVWRRIAEERDDRHEFLTAMRFTDLAAVAEFTGGDPQHSVVPPRARAVLDTFDAHSRHYELRRRHV